MKVTAFRIALSLSALTLMSGVALSDGTATGTVQPGTCKPTPAVSYHVGPNARHANTTQVRYTAAHAMPPARYVAASGTGAGCSFNTKKTVTTLN